MASINPADLTHVYECPHCADDGFYLNHAPLNGEPITGSIAYRGDGTCFGDDRLKRIKCVSCSLPINMLLSRNITAI